VPLGAGLRLAVTTFTVFPLAAGRVDRAAARTAMAFAPVVGALLGALLGGFGWCLVRAGAPPLIAAALTTGAAALLTRGLHLDGLADTTDALGSYGDRERALEIMKKPDIGPFGVTAIVLDLLLTTACLAALLPRSLPVTVTAVATAYAAGRLAATIGCARGVPAARPGGLGALVAGTVPRLLAMAAALAVAALGILAVPDRPWQGPLSVALAIGVTLLALRHLVRRLGGITGDVLGFLIEVATLASLVALTLD